MRLVIGNFKMNLDNREINEYLEFFKKDKYSNVIFAPTFIYLKDFINYGFEVASQDVAFAPKGAYTGDVSVNQLKSIGVKYSIVGHSERRKYYNDSKLVNDKVKLLLENSLIPIICIGETKEERELNKTKEVLFKEIDEAFKDIDQNMLNDIIIAYEPIWSIGTGVVPTNSEIYETIKDIKDYLESNYQVKLKVLYGGSVNINCIDNLSEVENIDGYLVGGCSIKKDEFKELITRAS